MRLERLSLQDFRGFSALELELDPRLTVLVGVNGSGKTSLLRAAAALLSQVLTGIRTSPGRGPRFADADVTAGHSSTRVTATAQLLGHRVTWSLAHVRPGYPREVTSDLVPLRETVERVQASIRDDKQMSLPLGIYYPVDRAVLDIPQRIRRRHQFEPVSAYDGALSGSSANFRLFFEWFREREDLENEKRARDPYKGLFEALRDGPPFVDPQLSAVRTAVERLMPGFHDLHIERSPYRMVVSKGDRALSMEQLSDGEKCSLALAGDLARRLVLANPSSAAPLDEEAVVLIDEVDLHLHPGWQREVVPRLLAAFPGCQFILTTHSPQVLSTVPVESLRLLEDFNVYRGQLPTRGRDSNAILSEVMGVPERPGDIKRRIDSIVQAIDEDRYEAARAELTELAGIVSEHDAEVVRLRALLRFLEDPVRDASHHEAP